MYLNRIHLILLLILLSLSHICFAKTIETQLSSDEVTLGDTLYITYTLNSRPTTSPDFSVLQKNFRILSTNYGNAVNMVNGVTSVQIFWRLQLQPKKAGELTIPEVSFGADKSTSVRLRINSNPVAQQVLNQKQGTPVFVRGEISTSSPYIQSQVIYTLKLYFHNQIMDPRIELPSLKDFVFFQLSDAQSSQTTINGTLYNVYEKTFALFPKKAGAIVIPPVQFNALTVDDNINPFNNAFGFSQPRPIASATRPLSLLVRDVPANYQGNAWLPAKNITLTERWNNNANRWESGTPVTRTLRIEAQGLSAEQLPDLSIDKIKGVSIYTERPKRSNETRHDKLIGVYEQKITYIPDNISSFTIPSLKINWWNTSTDAQAVTQLNEMAAQVKTIPSASINTPIKLPAPLLTTQPVITYKAFYTSVWFWVACALLVAWMVTLWFMLRKKGDKAIKQKSKPVEMSNKDFEQACRTGQAVQAQQYLLHWAKLHWPHAAFNLSTLREFISDESFNLAVQGLEQALYAKKAVRWNGEELLRAFQKIKKSRKGFKASKRENLQADPLPQLNPK